MNFRPNSDGSGVYIRETQHTYSKSSKEYRVLLEAERQSLNDGWVQRGNTTGNYSVTWWIADKLVKQGYLEKSSDGFAYRITAQGKQHLGGIDS